MPDPQALLPPPPWRCGEFVIDPDARLVTRDGVPMTVGARAFDLLLALANAQGRLASADALRAAVWPRARVAENNLRVQLTHLRKLLGAGAIEYRPKQGYRLTLVLRPTVASVEAPIAHAPEPTVEVLGRSTLLAGIADALQTRDRITLQGPAGAGKTLLAQAVVHRAAASFADGAWWVDLAPLSEASLLADAVAQALQLPSGPDAMARLASHLADRQLLLVLDNCEHLRDAVSALCDNLLRAAPRVTVLCTSRVALKCAGEQQVPVGPLDLPAPGATLEQARASGALAVFEARVRRLDARFKLMPGNLDAATDICRRLDGMAFAITVAAARVPALGLAEVRARLDERLQWRARPNADQADHQAALQDTLDWSHALLGAPAQRVLLALGVFGGSVALDDLRALLPALALDEAALLRALQDLVEHGFLQIDTPALLEAAPPRYGMHESVRLYARGRLAADGAADSLHAAHARHFMDRMAATHNVKSSHAINRSTGFELLAEMHAALAWASAHDQRLALALSAGCCMAWRRLGWHELARRLTTPLLAVPPSPEHVMPRADLLLGLCGIAFEQDHFDETVALAQQVIDLLEEGGHAPAEVAKAHAWQANVAAYRGQLDVAEAGYRRWLEIATAVGDMTGRRDALRNLGYVMQATGRYDEARPVLQESLSMSSSDDWGLMVSHENLGELEGNAGNHRAALHHFDRCVLLARRVPDAYRLANALALMAMLCAEEQMADSAGWLREAWGIASRQGFVRVQVYACIGLSRLLLARGAPVDALAVLHAVTLQRSRVGMPGLSVELRLETEARQRAQASLDAYGLATAQARGELLTLDEIASLVP